MIALIHGVKKMQITIPDQFKNAFYVLLEQGQELLTQHMSLDELFECDGFMKWLKTILKELK